VERICDLELRYQQLLEEFRQVTRTEEMRKVETYLLFLQVAGESFNDRQTFFDRFALSEGKMAIIALLKASGQSTPSELAEALGVTPGTITGLLAGLERSGHVRREEHPTDRRKTTITLTPDTLALFDQVLSERFYQIEALLSTFTQEEQEQLRTLLVKLHQQLVHASLL
jgi:MarR family transcriptional regulator, negative regulator of the multidrug operon emrRAB